MIRRVWDWFWFGRMCRRCKVERTGFRVFDEICMTCEVVEILKWRLP